MFRDSRGVVHTVAAPDPLDDLPAGASAALQAALLRPGARDVEGELERCEAVRELLDRWQDAFFAALPDDVDLDEEARWAAEAGLSLADVESEYDEDDGEDEDEDDDAPLASAADVDWGGLQARALGPGPDDDLHEPPPGTPLDPDDPRAVLEEELVAVLERELLLLPLRVRLEALVAAGDLVGTWADLLADHEKLLGHLVLAHQSLPLALSHEELAAQHADAHSSTGPGHEDAPAP